VGLPLAGQHVAQFTHHGQLLVQRALLLRLYGLYLGQLGLHLGRGRSSLHARGALPAGMTGSRRRRVGRRCHGPT
jgi:hypothetical protein